MIPGDRPAARPMVCTVVSAKPWACSEVTVASISCRLRKGSMPNFGNRAALPPNCQARMAVIGRPFNEKAAGTARTHGRSARQLCPLRGQAVAQLVDQPRELAAAALDHGRELVAEGEQQADALDRDIQHAPARRGGGGPPTPTGAAGGAPG